MVLKAELEIAYRLQQDFIKPVKSFIPREYPAPVKGNHVEVISGIRGFSKTGRGDWPKDKNLFFR